jgi:hypothetical protein
LYSSFLPFSFLFCSDSDLSSVFSSSLGLLIHLISVKPAFCGKATIHTWKPLFSSNLPIDFSSLQLLPHYEQSSVTGVLPITSGFSLIMKSSSSDDNDNDDVLLFSTDFLSSSSPSSYHTSSDSFEYRFDVVSPSSSSFNKMSDSSSYLMTINNPENHYLVRSVSLAFSLSTLLLLFYCLVSFSFSSHRFIMIKSLPFVK